MANLWIFSVLVTLAIAEIAYALSIGEALDNKIHDQLYMYEKIQKEADSAKYANELNDLIKITQKAIDAKSFFKKIKIITSVRKKFSYEFRKWIEGKIEEIRISDGIQNTIEFYRSLLASPSKYESEINEVISTLERVSKESDLGKKAVVLLRLEFSFSPGFKKFIKDVRRVNHQLETAIEFYEYLLEHKDMKFAKEVKDLKAKAETALESNISLNDKKEILYEVIFTPNEELNEFLHNKNRKYS